MTCLLWSILVPQQDICFFTFFVAENGSCSELTNVVVILTLVYVTQLSVLLFFVYNRQMHLTGGCSLLFCFKFSVMTNILLGS